MKNRTFICKSEIFFVLLRCLFGDGHILRRISVSAWQVNLENSSVPKEDKLSQSTVWCRLLLLIWDTGHSRAYLPVSEGSLFMYNLIEHCIGNEEKLFFTSNYRWN